MPFRAHALAALVLAAATAPGVAEPHAPPSLVDTLTLWLAANFDLPAAGEPPALVAAPPDRLVEMRYGPNAAVEPSTVVAVYDDAGTIYLGEDWQGRTPAELSILVHELVHHLQAEADRVFACPAEREVLAYAAQDAWLGLFGESLESAFGIDPGTIRVATACTH
jgi:hypothetical protein